MTAHTYGVIFSHPDQTGDAQLAHVTAPDYTEALNACWDAIESDDNIFEGCDFTIWPDPIN